MVQASISLSVDGNDLGSWFIFGVKIPGSLEDLVEILAVDIKFHGGGGCWRKNRQTPPPIQADLRHADAQIRLHLIEGTRALLGYLEEATDELGRWGSVAVGWLVG